MKDAKDRGSLVLYRSVDFLQQREFYSLKQSLHLRNRASF